MKATLQAHRIPLRRYEQRSNERQSRLQQEQYDERHETVNLRFISTCDTSTPHSAVQGCKQPH
jgi:hypothetical protein